MSTPHPPQRPGPEAREHGRLRGRWPQGTLFVAVLALLFGALVVLAIVGFIATR